MAEKYKYLKPEFSFEKNISKHPKFEEFSLHNHPGYEILFVVKGSAMHIVEGNSYHLSPGDMIIVRNDEFHQLIPEDELYIRYIIRLTKQFFVSHNIEEAVSVFEHRARGERNLISAGQTKSLKLEETIEKIDKYILSDAPESIIEGSVAEFLYLLSKAEQSSKPEKTADKHISEIIRYISKNYVTIENIDEIADKFFISKAHLCRKFKKETGFTVNRYITNKRLLNVKERYANGESLTKACIDAGFSSYAGFYKAYVKETNRPPKKMLD